jgi:hypothetical protein
VGQAGCERAQRGRLRSGIVQPGPFSAAQVIWPSGLARDNGFVGHGLVGVAGQNSSKSVLETDVQPRPSVVGLPFDLKLQSEVTVGDVFPVSNIGERAGQPNDFFESIRLTKAPTGTDPRASFQS